MAMLNNHMVIRDNKKWLVFQPEPQKTAHRFHVGSTLVPLVPLHLSIGTKKAMKRTLGTRAKWRLRNNLINGHFRNRFIGGTYHI